MNGTLAVWPPVKVRRVVNQLRKQYDPISHSVCEAHITLTQPFLHPPSENDWHQLEGIIAGFEPFSIRYGPLNTFLPYPCIYYEIHPAERVLEIRRALHKTGMFNLELPHTDDFVPHMSITDGRPDIIRTKEIFEDLRGVVVGGSFQCTEIAFIVPDSDFRFGIARTLPLGV